MLFVLSLPVSIFPRASLDSFSVHPSPRSAPLFAQPSLSFSFLVRCLSCLSPSVVCLGMLWLPLASKHNDIFGKRSTFSKVTVDISSPCISTFSNCRGCLETGQIYVPYFFLRFDHQPPGNGIVRHCSKRAENKMSAIFTLREIVLCEHMRLGNESNWVIMLSL